MAELKDTYHKERQKGDATHETCEQLKAQMRVMKRNVQYQMPDVYAYTYLCVCVCVCVMYTQIRVRESVCVCV